MARADYRLCDLCDEKAFYDASLNYDMDYRGDRVPPEERVRGTDYRLDYLGDWAVLCTDCAKTHRCEIVPVEQAAAPQPPEAQPVAGAEALTPAARDVLAERQRQVSVEGWTPEHDDEHARHELAIAAAVYAAPGARDGFGAGERPKNKLLPFWPWSRDAYKPAPRRRELVKAGALILAEIERLDRAAMSAAQAGDARKD